MIILHCKTSRVFWLKFEMPRASRDHSTFFQMDTVVSFASRKIVVPQMLWKHFVVFFLFILELISLDFESARIY